MHIKNLDHASQFMGLIEIIIGPILALVYILGWCYFTGGVVGHISFHMYNDSAGPADQHLDHWHDSTHLCTPSQPLFRLTSEWAFHQYYNSLP